MTAPTTRPHYVRPMPGGCVVEFKLRRLHNRTDYRTTEIKFS